MKFTCPKCSTRYSVSEDKLPKAAALRFTCKKCGNVIRVKRKDDEPRATPAPTGDVTRVASLAELRALRNASESATAPADGEWLVLQGGKQSAPKTKAQLAAMLAQGEIDKRAYVWREGMTEWQRLGNVAALAELAQPRSSAPPEPPAQAQEATRMMSVAQLQQLAREAKPEPAAPKVAPFVDSITAVMSSADLEAERAKMRAMQQPPAPAAQGQSPGLDSITAVMSSADLEHERAKMRAMQQPPALPPQGQSSGLDSITAVMSSADLEAERAKMQAQLAGMGAESSPVEMLTRQADESASNDEPELLDDADLIEDLDASDDVTHAAAPAVAPASAADGSGDEDALFGALISEAVADGAAPLSPFEHEPSGPFSSETGPFVAPAPVGEAYQTAPPGEATKVFMATAGIYRRRRNQKIAALVAAICLVILASMVGLDLAGVWTLPWMGVVYDVAGIRDPNVGRAVQRVEAKLRNKKLSDAEREALRKELLGLKADAEKSDHALATVRPLKEPKTPSEEQQGVVEPSQISGSERSFTQDVFADERKTEVGIKLTDPSEIQTPNLPDGLTQEAIYKVIADNNRSMKLCLEEAFKKGEQPKGRMEVQLTIAATGEVTEVTLPSQQFRSSAIGSCTIRRAKGWRFPRFNGEPVTVVFPYVLSAGF